MRRRPAICFLAVCVLLLQLLPGCARKSLKAEDLVFAFSCRIDVKSDCGDMKCNFVRSGSQSVGIRVLSGGAEGLSYDWNGSRFAVGYAGLSVENDSCVLPDTSFASLLVGCLDRAQQKDALAQSREGEFSGSFDGFHFLLRADASTGKITELSVPEKNLNVKFYEYAQQKL